VGWQPSRFLADRAEAERAFALAERLGSVNAAAAELGTTWPSLRKAFTRHGLGMPARNPEAARERAIEAARQRTGRPATPDLDPLFLALNHDELPVRARSGGELAERVGRAEDYATLGARVVVELHRESHAASPAPAPGRAPGAPTAATAARPTANSVVSAARPTAPAAPTNPGRGRWLPMPDDPIHSDQLDGEQRFRPPEPLSNPPGVDPGNLTARPGGLLDAANQRRRHCQGRGIRRRLVLFVDELDRWRRSR
jgi:hypothetical protein